MFLTEQQTYHFITRLYRDFVPECFWLKREEEIQGLTAAFKTEFENDRMVLPFCNSLNEFYAQAWRSLTAGKVVPDVTLAVLEFVVQDKQVHAFVMAERHCELQSGALCSHSCGNEGEQRRRRSARADNARGCQ